MSIRKVFSNFNSFFLNPANSQANNETTNNSAILRYRPNQNNNNYVKYGIPEIIEENYVKYGIPEDFDIEKYGIPDEPVEKYGIPDEPVEKYGIPDDPVEKYGIPDDPVEKYGIPDEPVEKYGIPDEPANKYDPPMKSKFSFLTNRNNEPISTKTEPNRKYTFMGSRLFFSKFSNFLMQFFNRK